MNDSTQGNMALSVFSTVMKTVCKALVFDSYLFECEMEITRLQINTSLMLELQRSQC